MRESAYEFKMGDMIEVSEGGCSIFDEDESGIFREFISMTSDGRYLCWTDDKSTAYAWAYARPAEYPKYMLSINKDKSEQYIVKFTSLKEGKVVAAVDVINHKLGETSDMWIEHTNSRVWKEVTNLNEIYDRDIVWCWDERS